MATMNDKAAIESNAANYTELSQILDSLQGVQYYTNVPSGKVYRVNQMILVSF